METIVHYKRQNKIQKEITRLWSIFTTDWDQVNRARDCGYEPCNFGATKKEKLGATLIVSSVVIPLVLPAPAVIPLSYKFLLGGRR